MAEGQNFTLAAPAAFFHKLPMAVVKNTSFHHGAAI
jgi:hypothetical protein